MSFHNFLEDMGQRPPGRTLERVNNNKGYTKANCVWATKREQALNRESTIRISHEGETHALTEWSEKTHIPYPTLKNRLRQGKLPPDLFAPVRRTAECEIGDEVRALYASGNFSQADLVRRFGVTPSKIYRIVRGLTSSHVSVDEIPKRKRRNNRQASRRS